MENSSAVSQRWTRLVLETCYSVGQCDLACTFLNATAECTRRSADQCCCSNAENIIKITYLLSQLNWVLWSRGKYLLSTYLLSLFIMLQLIYVFSLWSGLFHANMKAKYAIKGLLRIHAVKQTRKFFSLARKKYLMQIGFMRLMPINISSYAEWHHTNVQSASPNTKEKIQTQKLSPTCAICIQSRSVLETKINKRIFAWKS